MNQAENRVFTACTGAAAVAEVLVGAYRQKDPSIAASIREFFLSSGLIEVLGHDAYAFDSAARLRAATGLSLIDALHISTAIQAGCDGLVSNDKGLANIAGVEVMSLV